MYLAKKESLRLLQNAFLSAILVTCGQFSAKAQDAEDDEVYTVVEQMPEYQGGFNEFEKFLASELKYPAEAKQKQIQGVVFVHFIIEKDGTISDLRIIRSIEPSLDEEAMRIMRQSKWKAGKQNGKYVRVMTILPIRFNL